MPLGEAIDDPTSNDNYVAQLLASEAKDKSLKYSALGLQTYLTRRPTDRAPRPNTRFLKNILRDTDSHNSALRRKEEEESRQRMRKLRGENSSASRSSYRTERDQGRTRDYRDRSPRNSREGHSSREKDEDRRSTRRHRRDGSDNESGRDVSSKTRRRHRHRAEEKLPRRKREYSNSPHKSSQYDIGERSDRHRRHRYVERSRSRSPRRSRHCEVDGHDDLVQVEKPISKDSQRRSEKRSEEHSKRRYYSDEESDPLEDLVGPLPASLRKNKDASAVASRGRGSYRTNTSIMDSHFAHDYDPKLDVNISEDDDDTRRSTRRPVADLMTEDDDWDMALEALRDRAEWKRKGEERLRVAGFDGKVVERWKNHPAFAIGNNSTSDTEGRIDEVKWAKKGESREWDRGKVINEDGIYEVKAQW
ncbi:hypothetical protein BGW36DRAFT_388840 [Talaromyces proteolyticus]|uniref:Pre-mRNA-splicing factor 38B n=1 Tax=Talaromyces proteolyticus TaxID=1131652 RepID=A0AAD4PV98_9EURO|nr:uncharacterized protein BGW36DRAFT_388840 [Talaromyces proteolyticus]KAH8690488.1 hypothetical protein BGW36DRAFT_388840 [Talaromyces proteolyticus]